MRSRAPVLAAVAAVAVVQSLTGRAGAATGTPAVALTPPVRLPVPVRVPRPAPSSAGVPVPRSALAPVGLPAARPARRRLTSVAGALGAGALAVAMPAVLPAATSVDTVASAAEPGTAAPAHGVPEDAVALELARQRVLADRAEAAQAQATRASRAADPRTAVAAAPAPVAVAPAPAAAAVNPAPAPVVAAPAPVAPAPAPVVPEAVEPDVVAPVAAAVGSGYGPRWGRLHAGLDFPAPSGTPIAAVADGVVEQAGPAGGYGNLVTVRHADGTVTAYGHMRVMTVVPGQVVEAGQVIAEVGSEGRSTGPHLHFEVRTGSGAVDPRPWFAEHGVSL